MKQVVTAVMLVAIGTAALAHSGVKDKNVKARMDVMKAIGAQTKVLGSMAKGKTAFDAAAANAAVDQIAKHSAQVPALFETQASDPKSEASPAIWGDWSDFTALANNSTNTAMGLAGTISTKADLGPALKKLGATCKACHSKYRH